MRPSRPSHGLAGFEQGTVAGQQRSAVDPSACGDDGVGQFDLALATHRLNGLLLVSSGSRSPGIALLALLGQRVAAPLEPTRQIADIHADVLNRLFV